MRAVLWSAGTVIALVIVLIVGTDTVRLPRPSGPHLAGPANALTGNGRVADGPLPAPRPLAADQPLKLWIAGDSLAGSLGPSLGDMTAATGVVQPVYDSRVSTGLTTPSFFDWPKHAASEIARLQPEVVVFVIGTNDANLEPADSPTWKSDYANLVERMLSVLVGNPPRPVYWVGAPIMKDSLLSTHVRDVNAVAQDVISHHPEITYVDSYSLFADTDGSYSASLPDASGKRVLVRADDGVHFTPEGGDRLAALVFKLLDARWNITQQAVPGSAKQVIETKGSTKVPGTSRSTGSNGSNGSNGSTRQSTATSSSSRSTTTTSGLSATSSSTTPPTSQAATTSSAPSSTTSTKGTTLPSH